MENDGSVDLGAGQKDYLQDVETDLSQFEYASQSQRFVNWLVDNLVMRFGLSYLTGLLVGIVFGTMNIRLYSSSGIILLSLVIGYFNYILYYTICEKLFRGYTLGKLITGSRALRQDGQELTAKDAFLRSLSRCVPFEVFSGFSTLTWHDSWTDTMVVKSR